jgi:hypothetical protein
MASIEHASRVNTTNQTMTSGTYVDATNGDIASGSFTTGDQYLILAMVNLALVIVSRQLIYKLCTVAQPLLIASRFLQAPQALGGRLISGGQYGQLLVVRILTGC